MLGPAIFGLVAEAAGFPAIFLLAMSAVTATLAGWIVANARAA